MIDARELRIGNIVGHQDFDYTNDESEIHFIDVISELHDNIAKLYQNITKTKIQINYSKLIPIQLTPAILEKWCGFEKIDFDYFELKTEENFYCHIDEQGFGFALEHDNFYICEYVHELQNLYFALTGEELKVNYETNNFK